MKKYLAILAGLATLGGTADVAKAGSNPWIGEIAMVGFNFCPRGWLPANGQLLAISQYQALFSLFGTNFGGDGRTTFGLPDLRGRVAINNGKGPGLSNYKLGANGGAETNTMTIGQMPAHSHTITSQLKGLGTPAAAPTPGGGYNALSTVGNIYGTTGTVQNMSPDAVASSASNAGGGQPQNNIQPFLTLNFCVAMQGSYPPRP